MANTFENYRYEGDDLYITCSQCKIEKHSSMFWRNRNNYKIGFYYTCKECGNNKKTNLNNADEKFAQPAREILMCMGYDIEKDIHTQFLKRMRDKGRKL